MESGNFLVEVTSTSQEKKKKKNKNRWLIYYFWLIFSPQMLKHQVFCSALFHAVKTARNSAVQVHLIPNKKGNYKDWKTKLEQKYTGETFFFQPPEIPGNSECTSVFRGMKGASEQSFQWKWTRLWSELCHQNSIPAAGAVVVYWVKSHPDQPSQRHV